MSTGSRACAWIAAVGLALPPMGTAQDRPEREVVELIVRDGPQAKAIRAETEVARGEQLDRFGRPAARVSR